MMSLISNRRGILIYLLSDKYTSDYVTLSMTDHINLY
jgi:hypothetical protein